MNICLRDDTLTQVFETFDIDKSSTLKAMYYMKDNVCSNPRFDNYKWYVFH